MCIRDRGGAEQPPGQAERAVGGAAEAVPAAEYGEDEPGDGRREGRYLSLIHI